MTNCMSNSNADLMMIASSVDLSQKDSDVKLNAHAMMRWKLSALSIY